MPQSPIFRMLVLIEAFAATLLVACGERETTNKPYETLSLEYFDSLAEESYRTDSQTIWDNILRIARYDADGTASDRRTRQHYLQHSGSPDAFLWITRNGISDQADSLLACLDTCETEGVSKKTLRTERIRSDLEIARSLAFTEDCKEEMEINMVLARLEYNLTRAFLRYAVGQRYGFTNPKQILNRFEIRDSDSVRVTYRQLFDIPVHISGPQTYSQAMQSIRSDSVGWYLRQAMNHSTIYGELKKCLALPGEYDRVKVLTNMERARWHTPQRPEGDGEYVMVNIPSFHLWAMREGKVQLYSKIGCGAVRTKTPLVHSKIKRMDINPHWIIPMSIRRKELSRHAGNADYFHSRNYFAQNKKTGKKLTGAQITYDIINSNEWSVIQKGGQGNSLGRIIFRFDNNFSIYLHDTSSRSFFNTADRAVSHGCIRVEHPYELARFMLHGDEEGKAEMIRYSMEEDLTSPKTDKSKLLHSVTIEPQIPLFIEYYTLFPVPCDKVQSFPDVYGYDDLVWTELRKGI